MKTMKRVFSVLFLVVLVLSLSANAFAARDPYTYTVRVYPGNNGSVSSGEACITKSEITYVSGGAREFVSVSADAASITYNGTTIRLTDEKYYIRGIREAGKDDSPITGNFLVEQDKDYVVVYGMRGDAVQYTVYYVDADGNAMNSIDPSVPVSTMGYGSAGDKPVVGYFPIDGYQPQAYNLTKTLTDNGEDNVFTFVYTPVIGENPAAENPGENPAATPAAENPGESPAEEAAEDAAAGEDAAAEEIADDEVPLAEPEEILDMDVPLANGPFLESIGGLGLPASWTEGPGAVIAEHAVMAGIGGGVIVIAIALWLFLAGRKKDKENAK